MKSNLNSQKIIQKIEEKKDSIKELGVKKIGVFGSYLKKTNKPKKDIDILVSFNKPKFDSYMDLKFLLEKEFQKKIDLVIEKNLKPELNFVKKEAIYARL